VSVGRNALQSSVWSVGRCTADAADIHQTEPHTLPQILDHVFELLLLVLLAAYRRLLLISESVTLGSRRRRRRRKRLRMCGSFDSGGRHSISEARRTCVINDSAIGYNSGSHGGGVGVS